MNLSITHWKNTNTETDKKLSLASKMETKKNENTPSTFTF